MGRDNPKFNTGECKIRAPAAVQMRKSVINKLLKQQKVNKTNLLEHCSETATGVEIDSYKLKRAYTGRNSRAENWKDFCINLQLITGY